MVDSTSFRWTIHYLPSTIHHLLCHTVYHNIDYFGEYQRDDDPFQLIAFPVLQQVLE
jgi:hypothetical protein